jgi:tert-butyl alcohol monooxygenase / tert-amyl alcohol desaturase
MANSSTPTRSYNGYHKTHVPEHDPELTETRPGTPMGEYMRKSWHPVCLSEELQEVPKAIRILGEDLVAFRDRSGTVGVLHRHCSHRGTSLEFGIVQQKGIRCCYHGWVYDVDGTLLEAPAEPEQSRLYQTVCQGAYPAFEREGLVFAYLGPPEEIPAFPEYDAYRQPADNQLVAFSNIYPCNWLQVFENIMDHFHTALLHNNMTVASVDESIKDGLNFPNAFFDMPIMDWGTTRNGHGVAFIAGRRVDEQTIWVRMSEMVFPDLVHVSNLGSTAAQARHSSVSLSRWHTPVDDENCILFGWRHFNAEIDPHGESDATRCGYDKVDFLEGQVERPYDIGQRAPGDWDAITNQRPIAVHALETPATSDVGVFLCRKLLRQLVRGENGSDSTRPMSADGSDALHTCSSDTTLRLPLHPDKEVDKAQIKAMSRKVFEVMAAADAQPSSNRSAYISSELDAIDGQQLDAAE